MKRSCVLTMLIAAIALISCQSNSEKADKLRLENKFDEAAELYQKAADEGDAYAMWRLSNAYDNGDGVDWDEAKALELLNDLLKQDVKKQNAIWLLRICLIGII